MNREEFLAQRNQGRRDFSRADLRGIDLSELILRGAHLRGANLQNANLQGAELPFAHLQEADLQCADLRGANLQDASLFRADLRDANLKGANLQDASLFRADLRDANLKGADLKSAQFQNAKLQGAKLQGAKLELTNIDDIKLDTTTSFSSESYLRNSQGQFVPLQGSNAEKNKQLLKILSQKSFHLSFKSTEQLLIELTQACHSHPESAEAQMFFRHAPWTRVECVMLNDDRVNAYIPYGTTLNTNGALSSIHGLPHPPQPQVSQEFWEADDRQSAETHCIRLGNRLPDGRYGLAIHDKVLHHEAQEAPGSEDHTASDQAQDVASTSATANQAERFFGGPAHPDAGGPAHPAPDAPTQGSTQSGGPAAKKQ